MLIPSSLFVVWTNCFFIFVAEFFFVILRTYLFKLLSMINDTNINWCVISNPNNSYSTAYQVKYFQRIFWFVANSIKILTSKRKCTNDFTKEIDFTWDTNNFHVLHTAWRETLFVVNDLSLWFLKVQTIDECTLCSEPSTRSF